ncbi:hypothetical protein ACEPAI_2470 [Sanghuangporus weigelae]
MASTVSMPAFNVDITFGCIFISVVLWGVGCLQFYLYCEKYWNTEKRWFKVYMSTLWILDTVHQAIIASTVYVYLVKSIADPILLVHFQKTSSVISCLGAFIDAMVQAILIRRTWYLSNKNRILTGALSIAVLAQFAVTMALFVRFVSIVELLMIYNAIPVQLAAAAVVAITDTYLAVVLARLLRKARSGFRRSDSIVQRLVMYTIGSSLVTSICAMVALISCIVAPHAFIYLVSDLLIPKLYFNCLLVSLNARSSLRTVAEQESGGMSIHLEDLSSSSSGESNRSTSDSNKASIPKVIECRISIDVETGTDRTTAVNSKISVGLGISANI